MKRQEAITVLTELINNCTGLDGHSLELAPSLPKLEGYQIIIKGTLDEETKKKIMKSATEHQLAYQTGNIWKTKHSISKTEPDTIIIYKPKNKPL